MPDLSHVRWLGGGSGAAKSTVARALGDRYGVDVVSTDQSMADHAARLSPSRAPALQRFTAMTMDERWVLRSPEEMFATFHWFRGEGFELVVEDLRRRPTDRIVVVEGFRLLPRLVRPLLTAATDALWLLPTPEFRRRAFAARGSTLAIAGRTSDPPRALANLLARDALFTDSLAAELPPTQVQVVDGNLPVADLVDRVARRWNVS